MPWAWRLSALLATPAVRVPRFAAVTFAETLELSIWKRALPLLGRLMLPVLVVPSVLPAATVALPAMEIAPGPTVTAPVVVLKMPVPPERSAAPVPAPRVRLPLAATATDAAERAP